MFAQPLDGLSLRLNAARTENIASDVGLEVVDYYQKIARPLFANPAYATLSNGGQTIAALLTSADNNLRQMQNYDGRRNPPSSTWTGNMNMSYAFDRGTARIRAAVERDGENAVFRTDLGLPVTRGFVRG